MQTNHQRSQENIISGISKHFKRFTPLTKLWQIIKAFKGSRTPINKATLLIHNNTTYTTPQDIAHQFADFYHTVASNCPPPIPLILPDPTDNHPYNRPFTLTELEDAINRTGNTAPGPGQIHYHFKHLGQKGKILLLKALNHTFTTHTYPESCFHAHIIPIPKPQKPSTEPSSYRPISLTNNIHKIFERIKHRLLYIIHNRNLVSPDHCVAFFQENQPPITLSKSPPI